MDANSRKAATDPRWIGAGRELVEVGRPFGDERSVGGRSQRVPAQRTSAAWDGSRFLVDAQRGDPDAFAGLLRSWMGRLRSLARSRLGTELRRHVDSGDLVQDVMAEIVERFPTCRFPREGQFVSWVKRILSSKVADWARRAESSQVWLRSPSGRLLASRADRETPSRNLIRREDRKEIETALRSLKDRHQRVIRMRDIENLEYDVIARKMGLESVTAARMLRHRAWVHLVRVIELRRTAR